ncbi:SIR2 family protein [Bosea sp. 124]|uniref:SIR2 family protein n=1 Tax=Bosea sp. 124 TaxID=2135642 RepID=UPI000D399CF0|nr:SIR2 family protein [Bosea sp. 124]PTM40612.1 SIR2-like protein [Bosea sp. 124]
MDLDGIAKLAQSCFASNPVIVLGSGASAAHQLPGMDALRDHLTANIVAEGAEEIASWNAVRQSLDAGEHLEQALIGKDLPVALTRKIVAGTWQCINIGDKALFQRAMTADEAFPLGSLLAALFRSSNKTVDIVTTNYDRVAEYACNSADLLFSAGFVPGYLQAREGVDPVCFSRAGKQMRAVRIWKVHGSLDWFERADGSTVAAPLFDLPNAALTPLIVTPGFNKFERTHDEPFRSAIQGADRALENAEAFLCAGFGFRDTHIEPKMLGRCRQKSLPVTVLARSLTDEARTFLRMKAGAKYLGIERNGTGSKIYVAEHPDGIDIADQDFWSLDGFQKLVI